MTDQNRILVVDDEQNICEVITMALRYQGFTAETAATGREAIAAVTRFKPHLIVLDVMLGDMEGFEVAERLGAQRANLRRGEPPPVGELFGVPAVGSGRRLGERGA